MAVDMRMKSPELLVNIKKNTIEANDDLLSYSKVQISKELRVERWGATDGLKGGKILIFSQTNIRIEKNGSINVNGLGYRGGKGYSPGESLHGTTTTPTKESNFGGGAPSETYYAGSGSYGTKATSSFDIYEEHGEIYGNKQMSELHLGSGGGGCKLLPNICAGNGGGVILLHAKNEIIINGKITANGTIGDDKEGFTGCGSGGSIYIKAKTITMGDNAIISAVGGKVNGVYSLKGGDGRIIIDSDQIINGKGKINPKPYFG